MHLRPGFYRMVSRAATFVVGCWLSLMWTLPAWAAPEDSSGPKASWALAYMIVVLGIALGLIAVCRPGKRNKEIKLPDE